MGIKPHGPRVTRNIGPLSLRATLAPDSLNEKARTVDVVWTTGARVLRGFFENYYEELSLDPDHVRMDRLEGGAPLLNSHSGYDLGDVLGVVESARLEKGRGVATVRFAKAEDDPKADAIYRKVKDGVIRNVSVGYRVHRLEKVEEGEGQIPVMRATDWEPYEISLVPMGADAGAGVRGADAATNPCEFVLIKEREMPDPDDQRSEEAAEETTTTTEATEEVAAEGDGAGDAEASVPPAAPAADDAARSVNELATRAERKRAEGILRVAKALRLPQEFAARHVAAGTSLDKFRAEAQDMYEKDAIGFERGGPRVEAGVDARDKFLRGASDWLIQRAAVDGLVVEAARKRGETVKVDPGEFRGLGFVDLARMALERQGVRTAGMDKMSLVGMALTHRAGGMATTSDFSVLLENTLHKTLLAAYALAQDTWSLFCAIGSVSDFRPHNRYRMGTFGRLSTVNEHGEFTNQTIPDGEKETISAVTKGNIIALSRQALINDDMGAFSRLATMLGRAARLSIEADVYALLAQNSGLGPDMNDNDPLFDNNHNNIGTPSDLSVAGLDADRVTMAIQTDPSGNEFLDLRPDVLLVPVGLGGQAKALNEAQYDVTSGAVPQSPNIVRGLFRTVIDSPRLSGTRRYLLASPSIAPTFEVVFLDGQQTPFLENQNGWRIDGVEWKVRLDYGVGAVDFRGAVTNEGATES